jgi:ATP-dependent Zn protease
MSNDLISRESVLDYIEKEIATAKCTETISYLRALSVHINEYEPTAYDIDKVIEELEKLADELEEKALTMNKAECFDFANGLLSKAIGVRDTIDIIKVGGVND